MEGICQDKSIRQKMPVSYVTICIYFDASKPIFVMCRPPTIT